MRHISRGELIEGEREITTIDLYSSSLDISQKQVDKNGKILIESYSVVCLSTDDTKKLAEMLREEGW